MVEKIVYQGRLVSIIIRANFEKDGIEFFTPNEFSQQLAYMNRPKGYIIPPHVHKQVMREVTFTRETLIVKSGKVRVDFYDDDKTYIESTMLHKGDIMLLAFGGHGFEMIEPSEMIEVKQGPYVGEEEDKERFNAIDKSKIRIKEIK